MEIPNLGKHCAQEHCNQLDFLPLQCRCGKVFCSEHLNTHIQTCIESKFLSEDELRTIENIFICSKQGCKERSVVPLVCQRCKKHFCIHHRHLTECEEKSKTEIEKERERYAEPVRQFQEAKAAVDKEIENSLSQAKKKHKNKEMAAKVQLMKIKNKASGQKSIPTTDRVYFNIILPQNVDKAVKSIPVFVSKTWSLGRAIDAVADECKLQNNNNKSTGPRLRLFKSDDKNIVSSNMALNFGSLISDKVIVDGEDLIIEYVDDNCQSL